jgi:alkylation response protein AidB-like acyl-CoA dehydrogenase
VEQLLIELRSFLDAEVPAFRERWGAQADTWTARCDWQRVMATGKWAAPAWAVENGGRALGVIELLAVEELVTSYGMPALPGMLGLKNVGPTIAARGTEEQRRHLPKILSAEEVWCQGFSEPGAGSDLAGLRTRAVRDGDDFVVNGQKIWTSNGTHATHMQLLARTNPEAAKHRGISALLVSMDTPGVEVRPIKQITGESEFAEVFFTDARIPVKNLLGAENDGWNVTMTTLGHERSGVAIFTARLEEQVKELVARTAERTAETPLSAGQQDLLVRQYVETRVVAMLSRQMMAKLAEGQPPGAEQSVIKLAWSESSQRLSSVALSLAGTGAVTGDSGSDAAASDYLLSRAATIAGGTSQIVRNILAERVLGLPRA